MIFATFAGDDEQFQHAMILAESIRTFGGRLRNSSIWIYLPKGSSGIKSAGEKFVEKFDVMLRYSTAPAAAMKYPYAQKVFAAAQAEWETEQRNDILVWMDEDTILLESPELFELRENVLLGYRPVMHNIIGSLYNEEPDELWAYLYKILNVNPNTFFPMTTPADGAVIRPYFNAGILVVQPTKGILQKWAEDFKILYKDDYLFGLSESNHLIKIFLHQFALVSAVLNTLDQNQMMEFPISVNYPLFFKEMFGADQEFDTLEDVITLRYDAYFRDPAPNWQTQLRGDKTKVNWICERLTK
ncbi:MAG: hypothetical protein H8D46_04910 [FCB group bacterium]|nr:hypothetical protein [FCB group bacterium]